MTTHRSFLVTLLVIVFLSALLSACSSNPGHDMISLYAQANDDGSALASHSSVEFSSRNTCKLSPQTQLLSAIDHDLNAESQAQGKTVTELGITTDAWLDLHMAKFTCIIDKQDAQE